MNLMPGTGVFYYGGVLPGGLAKVKRRAFLFCVRNSQISFAAYSSMGFKCCAAGVVFLLHLPAFKCYPEVDQAKKSVVY